MATSAWTGARVGQMTDAPLGGYYLSELLTELEPWTRPAFPNYAAMVAGLQAWQAAGNTAKPGMEARTTNDGQLWYFDGGSWVWPRESQRELGYVERDTGAGPVTRAAGITSISGTQVSITIPSARIVRAAVSGQITSDAATTTVALYLVNSTSGAQKSGSHNISVANVAEEIALVLRESLAAGTYSYTLKLAQVGGGGSAFTGAEPLILSIEDLGAA